VLASLGYADNPDLQILLKVLADSIVEITRISIFSYDQSVGCVTSDSHIDHVIVVKVQ